MIPESPEVRWHAATAAFDEDEFEPDEMDAAALIMALAIVAITLLVWWLV